MHWEVVGFGGAHHGDGYRSVMLTGRRLAEDGLARSMPDFGWTPRTRGWFTKAFEQSNVGVVAVSAATKYAEKGTAWVTLHVGMRHGAVERTVAELLGTTDDYQTRTAITSIGYLLEQPKWTEWLITPENADAETRAMAQLVNECADPHLRRLAEDPMALIEQSNREGIVGAVRYCILLASVGDKQRAREAMESFELEARTAQGPFGVEARAACKSLATWLDSH